MTREAELELEIARLREAIESLWKIIDDIDTYGDMAKSDDKLFRTLTERRQKDRWKTGITTDGYSLNIQALSTPPSTTALQDLINEVERRTIERCAVLMLNSGIGGNYLEEAIRALPTGNLKLEDLK